MIAVLPNKVRIETQRRIYDGQVLSKRFYQPFTSAVTLSPKENGTQITFESQFGLAGILKFAEGMFRKLATKGDGDNFDTAKRLLEAG